MKRSQTPDPHKVEYIGSDGMKLYRCSFCKRDGFKQFGRHICGRPKVNQIVQLDSVAEVMPKEKGSRWN
jgi:hypothetical protein